MYMAHCIKNYWMFLFQDLSEDCTSLYECESLVNDCADDVEVGDAALDTSERDGAVENITGGSRYIVTALGDGCLAGVLVHQSQLGCRIDLLDS
jgi:hypothetical protein